ncbi:hypothetical protein Baya_8936 [Bagarius yarrelli]|uniref:Uncharacterized protein n=1 Tax=Bagarius yarrelli TaxID=175774 RepID=A0A556U7M9_BAGYA|nr:hypothetical protein Baya_8936 [Bagarius yarrelli]
MMAPSEQALHLKGQLKAQHQKLRNRENWRLLGSALADLITGTGPIVLLFPRDSQYIGRRPTSWPLGGALMHQGADGLGGELTAANCQDENGGTKYGRDSVCEKTQRLAVGEKMMEWNMPSDS